MPNEQMSTKLKQPPRRFPTLGASNKRKERDGFDACKIPKLPKLVTPQPHLPTTFRASPEYLEPALHNRLLAGYLAHEFLTKGTLFGEKWSSAGAEAKPVPNEREEAEPKVEALRRYVALADLLKTDGAHIPGIINPTQLGRYLQM